MTPLTTEERVLYAKVRDSVDDDTLLDLCASHQSDDCGFAVPTEHRDGTITFDKDCGHYLFDDDGKMADPDNEDACPFIAVFVTEYGAVLVREGL